MRPEQDELRPARSGAAPHKIRTTAKPQSRSAPSTSSFGSALSLMALLVALVSATAAAYLYWQVGQTQYKLAAYEQRITQMEGQLAMTGDESEASMAAVQAKLKWADSEIRKLWGVSHDRNRKAIESNTENLAAVKKSLADLSASLKKQADTLAKQVSAQQTVVQELKNAGLRNTTQVQMMVDQLDQLENLQLELGKRIKNTEQAMESVDAFRRTVNRDILQLQQRTAGAPQ